MNPMNWYVAEAVFQSSIEGVGTNYDPLVERSWFLVSAGSENAAREKAVLLGRSKEHSYSNSEGENVVWQLKTIENIREVMDEVLVDGTEVWSTMARSSDSVSQ